MVSSSDEGRRPPSPPAGDGVPAELRELGQYRLLKVLGRGAQGVVYLAEDTQLQRKVALKMLEGGNALLRNVRERFEREAQVASRLDHPGICGIHEVGEIRGLPYIAMQYVRGTTLADMIERARSGEDPGEREADDHGRSTTSLAGKDALQDALRLIERSARALHAAHEAGLIHRDIKPGNIMVTPEGDPVLLDFGLARDVEAHGQTLTETGQVLGTPAYMAPEQLRGIRDKIDRKTDVYGLGVTLFECLTLDRPFSAETFEGLFQEILQGTPLSPRKLNARIPRDLATVIEVAMERERDRRYPTALDFAEDLRRVRSFEPILAKAAGPLTRARKWARRRPAVAVAIAAIALIALLGLGLLTGGELARRREASRSLQRTEELLAAGDFDGALTALAQAESLRGDTLQTVALRVLIEDERERELSEQRRREDLEAVAEARAQAADLKADYESLRVEIVAIEERLAGERAAVQAAFAPGAARAEYAGLEQERARLRLEAEQVLQEARQALDRAARLEAPWGRTAKTDEAYAGFYLMLWRQAIAEGDAALERFVRPLVEQHDPTGALADELRGRALLALEAIPSEAELHLFRFEPYESVRPGDVVPRLVPVPTSGLGRARAGPWVEEFHPGDPCAVITHVEAGSLAARAGLVAGDLVIRFDGRPVADGLLLAEPPHGPIADAGVPLLARVESLNGAPVASRLDWIAAPRREDGGEDRVRFAGLAAELLVPREEVRLLATPRELVERGGLEMDTELLCLRAGERLVLEVPAGARAGLRTEPSAYPLICSVENRVGTSAPLEVDAGSYLVLARAPGCDPQRVPLLVERGAEVEARIELLPEGETPAGFVYVPAGPFRAGGDPVAQEALPAREVDLPGFFVARRELTNREWDEFRADPRTRERMSASAAAIYVPREGGRPMPVENLGGPDTPVMGVSWNDARDYLAWRNARAARDGEPWVYELPSEDEWEKAARGVDGRAFPWGDRFDFDLLVGLYSKPVNLFDAPGGFEPRDESPYGVQDLGGLRREWTRDTFVMDPRAPTFYRMRGGTWRSSFDQLFRSASRFFGSPDFTGADTGLRLVARPRG